MMFQEVRVDKPVTFESRTVNAQFEMRDDSAGAPILEGYAATFNQEYDLGPFRERIDPSAFTRTLSNGPDVRLLVDHEGQPLARTKSGTLTLSTDSQGLHARATLDPADPDVQRLLPKMRRGDLDQMSFAFRVPAGGDSWENDYTLRTIIEASLSGGDVSVVTYPANPHTAVTVRSDSPNEADYVFVERLMREHRAGAAISSANMTRLRSVLSAISVADDNLDQAQADLADVLGVDNPDPAEVPDAQQNSLRVGFARRKAIALSL
jgi:HK97 family phage prohead protease